MSASYAGSHMRPISYIGVRNGELFAEQSKLIVASGEHRSSPVPNHD